MKYLLLLVCFLLGCQSSTETETETNKLNSDEIDDMNELIEYCETGKIISEITYGGNPDDPLSNFENTVAYSVIVDSVQKILKENKIESAVEGCRLNPPVDGIVFSSDYQ